MQLGVLAGYVAGLFVLVSYLFYVVSILKGETKPNRTSWWIWAFSGVIITFSYYHAGAYQTLWVPIGEVIGPLIVAFLSIKKGVGGWTTVDRFSIIGALLSLVLWYFSGSAFLTLTFLLAVDFFGAFPTILKAYRDPKSEDVPAWVFVFFANILNIFAAETFSVEILVHPLYMTFINGLIFILLVVRRRYRSIEKTI